MVFQDAAAAQEGLELIAREEELAEARVLARDGSLLAQWQAPDSGYCARLESPIANALLPQPLVQPIVYQGHVRGELQLSSQGGSLTRFLRHGLLTLLGCLLFSLTLVYYSSRRVRRRIMKPLQRLSDVATAIARERSFTQRVPASNIVELDDLAENFNRLLDEIEAWQNQLQGENVSLAHQASHDSLTSLPNRSQFEPALSRAAREADSNQAGVAVMFIAAITSSRSTTSVATPQVTRYWSASPSACAASCAKKTWLRASAATSSRYCSSRSSRTPMRCRSPTRSSAA